MCLSWQRASVAVSVVRQCQVTVEGGGTTVWKGTAFDCLEQDDGIVLCHTQFESGRATGVCNNGMIIGRSLNRTFEWYRKYDIMN